MPIRDRLRRVFRRSHTSTSSTPSSSLTSSSTASSHPDQSIIYQPGEKMPPPKYRRPVAKEHKEKLESFSFANAWRRRSFQSAYSPMGSRMPSRMGSLRKSWDGERTASFRERVDMPPDHVGQLGHTSEGDSDGDVANVGLSRNHSHKERPDTAVNLTTASREPTSSNNRPFDPDELSLAIKRSHLAVPA